MGAYREHGKANRTGMARFKADRLPQLARMDGLDLPGSPTATRLRAGFRWALPNRNVGFMDIFAFSIEELVAWLASFPAVSVLALITVTGETVVLAATMVATQGSWSLAEVVAWCFLGTVISDAAWFKAAGVVDRRWLSAKAHGARYERTVAWLRAHTGERPYLALLFIKFLYGSRFLMLVYLATRRVTLRQFLVYDAIGTAVWLAVLVPAGWLLAHGLVTVADVGRIEWVMLGLVAVLVALRLLSTAITKRVGGRDNPTPETPAEPIVGVSRRP